MGHTAVSTIKVSSMTLKIWQHGVAKIHPIDSLYTGESVKDTVPVIGHIFGAKNARYSSG